MSFNSVISDIRGKGTSLQDHVIGFYFYFLNYISEIFLFKLNIIILILILLIS